MIYSAEVQHMCSVGKGAYHGPAPIPEEGKKASGRALKLNISFVCCLSTVVRDVRPLV